MRLVLYDFSKYRDSLTLSNNLPDECLGLPATATDMPETEAEPSISKWEPDLSRGYVMTLASMR